MTNVPPTPSSYSQGDLQAAAAQLYLNEKGSGVAPGGTAGGVAATINVFINYYQ